MGGININIQNYSSDFVFCRLKQVVPPHLKVHCTGLTLTAHTSINPHFLVSRSDPEG